MRARRCSDGQGPVIRSERGGAMTPMKHRGLVQPDIPGAWLRRLFVALGPSRVHHAGRSRSTQGWWVTPRRSTTCRSPIHPDDAAIHRWRQRRTTEADISDRDQNIPYPPRLLEVHKLIEDEFGDLPIAALADRRVRGEFKSWRDDPQTHRARLILPGRCWRASCPSKDRGIIASNPSERGGRLYVADRRDKIWTEQESPQLVREEALRFSLLTCLTSPRRTGGSPSRPFAAKRGAIAPALTG